MPPKPPPASPQLAAMAHRDAYFRLAQHPTFKSFLGRLGLPTPVPLERNAAGRFPHPLPLAERQVTVVSAPGAPPSLSDGLNRLGATVVDAELSSSSGGLEMEAAGGASQGLLVDATWLREPADVTTLAMRVLQPALAAAAPGTNGRVLLLAADEDEEGGGGRGPMAAALAAGLGAMVRSLAKEMGRRGTTVNLLRVRNRPSSSSSSAAAGLPLHDPSSGGGSNLAWPVSFFLSPDSAFVTGQELTVDMGVPSLAAVHGGGEGPVLKGRVCLVTGASQGIGEGICRRLAAEGAQIIGVDLPSDAVQARLKALMAELNGVPVAQDVSDPAAGPRLAEAVRAEAPGGRVDCLVHNAGLTRDRTLARMDWTRFEQVVRVNLEAVMRINAAFGLHGALGGQAASAASGGMGGRSDLLLNPGGRVLLQASINGIAGALGQTNYSFTKGALIGYAHALSRGGRSGGDSDAERLRKEGITVNCIAPGFIETHMTAAIPSHLRFFGRHFNALAQSGFPEDIAAAAAFLCAEGSRGVRGQTLRVCGLNAIGR